jgi:glutamine amidotransferase
MISILDYGLGNVLAFSNVYKRLHIPVNVAKTAADVEQASKLILPGVGAFDHAMELLNASGMREKLDEMVLEHGVPVLGVCVGMQILGRSSEEGALPGLGWIEGRVRRFDQKMTSPSIRLPHMGWNDVQPRSGSRLFTTLEADARFYFLHSYYFDCASSDDVLAKSEYGIAFACAVATKNIYGVQFHPEKSHHYGARLLQNFAEL